MLGKQKLKDFSVGNLGQSTAGSIIGDATYVPAENDLEFYVRNVQCNFSGI